LPPATLPNLRTQRYRGGTFAVSLAVFAAQDQATLRTLYRLLAELWRVLTTPPAGDSTMVQAVAQFAARPDWQQVRVALQEIGTATPDPTLDLVIHDLRGGSFTALIGLLDLLTRRGALPRAVPTLVVLVRDHRHALRNLVPELDPAGAEADQQPQPQSIARLVEKWRVGGTVARVQLDVPTDAAIAARPSELAAMDGVVTNLVNNAVRFAADGQVDLTVLPHAGGPRCAGRGQQRADGGAPGGAAHPRGHGLGTPVCGRVYHGRHGVGVTHLRRICGGVLWAGGNAAGGGGAVSGGDGAGRDVCGLVPLAAAGSGGRRAARRRRRRV
jgi:hypothetical protein